jgi:SAM-dependent methyltransferase/uncharacterized protein YbaR (Trm112 family)
VNHELHPWLAENLRCPRDRTSLTVQGSRLHCAQGHAYPIHDGVPVMLLEEKPDTEPVFAESLKHAAEGTYMDPRKDNPLQPGEVDHIVQRLVAGSCGNMYRPLVENLTRYPIPRHHLKLPPGSYMLDIGCAWGRWSLAAAGMGCRAVGIDPSIYNILAARRIAQQLGHKDNLYLVADGRFLPFAEGCFDAAFSYSCLQHMAEEDVRLVLAEIRRTLKPGGRSMIEMPNKWGLKNLSVQAARRFRRATYTEVRYWTPKDLIDTFTRCIGPSKISVDGFFCINPQISDLDLLPLRYKAVVLASEGLRALSTVLPFLRNVADSLYVTSSPGEQIS